MLCMGNVDGALTVSFVIFTDLAVCRLSDFAALCCLVIEHSSPQIFHVKVGERIEAG